MKSPLQIAAKLLIVLLAASAVRCSDVCTVESVYYYTEPIYTSFEVIRASVKSEEPRDLVNAGKIYFKDDFIYVNEQDKGVHVIDNHDPANPQRVSFIKIPGSYDLVIYGNILYADSYVDLVAIDVSVPGQEHEVGRYENMFDNYSRMRWSGDPARGVITGIDVVKKVTISDDCNGEWYGLGWRQYEGGYLMTADAMYSATSSGSKAPSNVSPGNTAGVGGSMARFTIASDRLYTLDNNQMHVIDIANPSAITIKKSVPINWDVETIFPYGTNIFLGSQTGMHIYNITNAEDPQKLSTFSHIRSCDPVVVEGQYAYVTLRSNTSCNGVVNELQVINISNLTSPSLIKSYNMKNPHGLGIDNNVLFICDGEDGLKVYDATDKFSIGSNLKAHYTGIQAFDIIPFNKVAMMIGEDGLYQYDYSDIQNIRQISRIEIKQEEE